MMTDVQMQERARQVAAELLSTAVELSHVIPCSENGECDAGFVLTVKAQETVKKQVLAAMREAAAQASMQEAEMWLDNLAGSLTPFLAQWAKKRIAELKAAVKGGK